MNCKYVIDDGRPSSRQSYMTLNPQRGLRKSLHDVEGVAMRDCYKRQSDPLIGLWVVAVVASWLLIWGAYAFASWVFERLAPLLG